VEEQGYKGEFEKTFERIDTPKGVTLGDLRRAHKDDVRYFHGRINETYEAARVLARRCGELETQVPKVVKMFRPQGPCLNEYGVLMYQGGNCSACGAAVRSTASFCSGCGAKLDWTEGGEA
jgi:hypothetical protein